MSEILTPPKWVERQRMSDRRRIEELEARVERLEQHYHATSEMGGNSSLPMVDGG